MILAPILRIVAVGVLFSSSPGHIFHPQSNANVTATHVATGSANLFAYSLDEGATWQLADMSGVGITGSQGWTVVCNGSIWVAVAAASLQLLTSLDGITWTRQADPPAVLGNSTWPSTLKWIAPKGAFLSVNGSSGTATSVDGITWIAGGSTGTTTGVTGDATNYVSQATGGSSGRYSPTGAVWTSVGAFNTRGVASNGTGTFVAISSTLASKRSLNSGVTWSNGGNTTATWTRGGLAYGAGVFVGIGNDSGTPRSFTTADDGLTWTDRTATIPAGLWYQIIYARSRFVAIAQDDLVAISSDGIAWTTYALPSSGVNTWFSIAAYGVPTP